MREVRAGIRTFTGDPKFYVEVESTSLLPNLDRYWHQGKEVFYLRHGYVNKEDALRVAREIMERGVTQREDV